MTKAEKLILKDETSKKAVVNVLSLFRGQSHQFTTDVLKAALHFVSANAYFNFERTVQGINAFIIDNQKK